MIVTESIQVTHRYLVVALVEYVDGTSTRTRDEVRASNPTEAGQAFASFAICEVTEVRTVTIVSTRRIKTVPALTANG